MNGRPIKEPSILYKYRDDSERTEDILRKKKVWLSCPSQLNDPLECKPGQIPAAWKASTIKQLEEGQLLGVMGLPGRPIPKTLFSLSERQTRKWWAKLRKLPHQDKVKAMRKLYSDHGIELSRPELIFDDMRQRLRQVGVFSLSESNSNELMWSHYGASHAGLALGFGRIEGSKLGDDRHTMSVAYMAEKPKFKAGFKNQVAIYAAQGGGTRSIQRVSFEDDVFRASLSTKTPAWSYEREWRYVEETHGLFDWPGPLRSITFGLRMSLDRREVYKRLVREALGADVAYYEMKQNNSANGFAVGKA